MCSMTSQGSPQARFRRALATGNLLIVRAATAELPRIDLADALDVCALICRVETENYEKAALRWVGRFAHERAVDLVAVAEAADALGLLRVDPDTARRELLDLLRARR